MPRTRTIGLAATVAGLLLAQSGCGGAGDAGPSTADYGVNPEVEAAQENRSTFALDVDTGSYTLTRRYLQDGFLPDPESVRTEEFVNYFAQDYDPPADGIGIHVDGTSVPFLAGTRQRVIRVGLQGAVVESRQPANLTLVVDVSGSMEGPHLEMVQAGLDRLVGSLGPADAVAIVTFSDDADLLLPMTPMTQAAEIRAAVAELTPDAATNLEAGLRLGYAHAQENLREDGLNRVVLLSDGEANRGETSPDSLADQIAQAAGRSTQLVVVGVGRETYNEAVLEQFADQGNGFFAYVDTVREAERLFVHDLTGTLQAVALDAKVQVTFAPEAVSRFRLLGYENRQLDPEDLRDDTVDGGEVGAGHTVTALYEVTLAEGGERDAGAELATVEVRWVDPEHGEPVERSATISAGDLVAFGQAPPRLRQDIVVAAFAESLRDAPWSALVSPAQIADNAQVLRAGLPGDEQVAELADLARIAADLTGAH